MTYPEALKQCLLANWFDFVRRDSICGNGFQITWYGLTLIVKYIFLLVFRIVVVALLPLSALLLLQIEKKTLAHNAKSKEVINFLSR